MSVIITMTSDLGLKDYYVPVIKGAMLCRHPQLNIVDISHNINHYDIVQSAFVLRNAWESFPKGTIHVVSVNNIEQEAVHYLSIRHGEHYFIGPDNGIFSLVFDETPSEIYRLPVNQTGAFPLKDVLANAVGHLAEGLPIEDIGERVHDMVRRISIQPVINPSGIRGSVIHIDNYENVIVNIKCALFERVANNRPFSIYFKRYDPITHLCEHYYDVPVGEMLCLFNSASYLEIAINMGCAASLLGLKLEDSVQIDFQEIR